MKRTFACLLLIFLFGFSSASAENTLEKVGRTGTLTIGTRTGSPPPPRIPLLTSNAVDLIAETMTDTKERRESVDFSLTFFYTGAQFLVKAGSPISGIQSVAGKRVAGQRVATQQAATNARILPERVPSVKLVESPDQPAAFQALAQGRRLIGEF